MEGLVLCVWEIQSFSWSPGRLGLRLLFSDGTSHLECPSYFLPSFKAFSSDVSFLHCDRNPIQIVISKKGIYQFTESPVVDCRHGWIWGTQIISPEIWLSPSTAFAFCCGTFFEGWVPHTRFASAAWRWHPTGLTTPRERGPRGWLTLCQIKSNLIAELWLALAICPFQEHMLRVTFCTLVLYYRQGQQATSTTSTSTWHPTSPALGEL